VPSPGVQVCVCVCMCARTRAHTQEPTLHKVPFFLGQVCVCVFVCVWGCFHVRTCGCVVQRVAEWCHVVFLCVFGLFACAHGWLCVVQRVAEWCRVLQCVAECWLVAAGVRKRERERAAGVSRRDGVLFSNMHFSFPICISPSQKILTSTPANQKLILRVDLRHSKTHGANCSRLCWSGCHQSTNF